MKWRPPEEEPAPETFHGVKSAAPRCHQRHRGEKSLKNLPTRCHQRHREAGFDTFHGVTSDTLLEVSPRSGAANTEEPTAKTKTKPASDEHDVCHGGPV